MNTSTPQRERQAVVESSNRETGSLSSPRRVSVLRRAANWLAALACLWMTTASVRADRSPTNCAGSAIGISLYTSIPDVHIGDTLFYSINVFNGVAGSGRIACDATEIEAFIVTPDGRTNNVTLSRTSLKQGEADFYPDVVSYVVRAQDIQPDGTLLATAQDKANIHQNDTNSKGGAFQGVNTEVNLPCIKITALCVGGVGENGLINFTGTVTNCGNNTLVGLTVTNFHDGGFFTVVFPTNLAIGQSVNFSGSFIPFNPCAPATAILTVRARDEFTATPQLVTNFTTYACQNTLTPGIQVTKTCPVGPVSPGQLLTFTGTVRNTGNVTLTNVVVVNNQPAANTSVFTVASLAPGDVANFSGSYLAPTNCSVADTLTATATSRCGGAVSSSATAVCPILTTPRLVVTAACPVAPVVPGGAVSYTGTVRNTGDITLNNVVVVSDHPANTTVFTMASLAPGAVATFTSTYNLPANTCAVVTTFTGTGKDSCTQTPVTNITTTVCNVTTAPAIAVTLVCPAGTAVAGAPITYTGTVRNTGNVQLNNVTVNSSQAVPSTVLTVPALAPGASANFTVTFTAIGDTCSVTSSVTATGSDDCTTLPVSSTATAICSLSTTPGITLTQLCPVAPAVPGGLLTYTGTVRNSGTVTLTNVVVMNNLSGGSPIFTVATLAPGDVLPYTGTYLATTNCSITSVSTATARSTCGFAVTNSVSLVCPILTTPQIAVTATCPPGAILPGGSLTYSGTVQNTGNITLTNVVVVSDRPAANTSVFTVATLAPGAVAAFTGTYVVPANACSVITTFSGTAKDICTLTSVTNTTTTACTVTTAPAIAVTLNCPLTAATSGGLITYTGTVRNTGNVTLNNVFVVNNQPGPNTPVIGPITLAPGASSNFSTSFTSPGDACSVSSTVIATGHDNCTDALVSNSATAVCPLNTTAAVTITQFCPVTPAVPGQLLVYTGTVQNTGNVTLTNVVVRNNLSGATPVFTAATLAPGAAVPYTGSFLTPTNCLISSITTVTGGSICGVAVTSTATTTCPILTTPAIFVIQYCPTNSVLQGGLLNYSGIVSNAGNITLTNIIVVNDRPATNTLIFTLATLAPGATAKFTGSYVVPTNCCESTSTVRASGQGCAGETVTDTDTRTCPVLTLPMIAVTKICPPGSLRPGDLLTYSGVVSNTGNITLINVFVVGNQPANNTPLLGPLTLAPGESAPYAGSYLVPADFCGADTVTATGLDLCTFLPVVKTVTTTCPVTTAPRITVTKNCPLLPTPRGGLYTFTGVVSNPGNVTLVNVYVVDNQPSNNTPVIGPITLAPGASFPFSSSYLAPSCPFENCCFIIDTLTARGQDRCSGSNVTSTATAVCPLLILPGLAVVQACPPAPILMGSLYTYSGFVTNTGNIVLTNVFVYGPQGTNFPVLGPIELAPGEIEFYAGSYTVPFDTCSVVVTTRGQDICAGTAATNLASCPVATTTLLVLTQNCPAIPVSPGSVMNYSGTVSNAGNITITNVTVLNSLSGGSPILAATTLAPGQAANFNGSYLAPTNCFATSISTATGQSICGVPVTGFVSSTCLILTTPQIAVSAICPVAPVIPGSSLTYTGTVRNTGDTTLTNVVVTSDRPVPLTTVFTVASLAPGAIATFSGTYTVPLNVCTVTALISATGSDICTNATVTNLFAATCTVTTSPLLAITQACPPTAVSPGGLLVYSGTVSNAGNITLNSVVVTNSQSGNTPLITVATLLPGASSNFTGSYLAPVGGLTSTSISTARATSLCSAPVSNSVSSTCPVVSQPGLAVVKLCPPVPVSVGGFLMFSGTVANTGNVTLTNVFVVNNQPVPNTPVVGPFTLAPGASSNFTGSYLAPMNVCALADTLTSTGNDASSGVILTNTDTANCPVVTTPAITVTETCPPGLVTNGTPVVFTGSVSNSGNITLTNVLVFSSQPTNNSPVFGPITLAPGASSNYIGTYLAVSGTSLTTNTTIVTNTNNVITTNSADVITTNTTVTITTNNILPTFGTIDPVSGVLSNRFNVTSNLHGLMFADQEENWGPTLFYVTRHPTSGPDQFATISTLTTPTNTTGAVTDRFSLSSTNYDALTIAASDVGYGVDNFYYLRHDSPGVTTFGVIKAAGASTSSDLPVSPISGSNYNSLSFAAANVGAYGANLFYTLRETNGITVFGTLDPTPGLVALDRYAVGTNANFDTMVFVPGAVSSWGTAIFAYLRHDTNGSIIGTIDPVSHAVLDRIDLGTNFITGLTFTATDVGYGPNLFYFLRPESTLVTTNSVTNFTTNVVVTFTTNLVTTFTTNNVVTFMPTNSVTATGRDLCLGRTVAAGADCSGPVVVVPASTPLPPALAPLLRAPAFTNRFVNLSFPSESGRWYSVQFKDSMVAPTWTTLETIIGNGAVQMSTDPGAALHPNRFYRVMLAE